MQSRPDSQEILAAPPEVLTEGKISSPQEARDLYVEKVKQLEVVQEVRYFGSEDAICILTLISAPPWDNRARRPVYEAQGEVIDTFTKPMIDFRLIHLNEFPGRSQEDFLPSDTELIWKRTDA